MLEWGRGGVSVCVRLKLHSMRFPCCDAKYLSAVGGVYKAGEGHGK